MQVFRHLDTDKAAADDHGAARLRLVQVAHDAIKIGNVAQTEDTLRIDSREARTYGLSARREQHTVVAFVVFLSGIEVAQAHCLIGAVNRHGFGTHAHVYAIALMKRFSASYKQLIAFADSARDVVRQTAVGKADEGATFDEHDLSGFAVSAQTGGCGGATSHATNNDCFHRYNSVREKGFEDRAHCLRYGFTQPRFGIGHAIRTRFIFRGKKLRPDGVLNFVSTMEVLWIAFRRDFREGI